MPDILLAVAKGLAGIPGLAPVFSPLVSLREEEKSAESNAMLLAAIDEGAVASQDALDEVLVAARGIHEDNTLFRAQMEDGVHAVLNLLRSRHDLLLAAAAEDLSADAVGTLEQGVSDLVAQHADVLIGEGPVTREALIDELVRLFTDANMLLTIVDNAGFPRGEVTTNAAPRRVYAEFLQACEGLEPRRVAGIAAALARRRPGSALLGRWSDTYARYARAEGTP